MKIVLSQHTSQDFRRTTVDNFIFTTVKINFKFKQPAIGKMVMLDDGEDLLRKDMVRFIKEADCKNFDINFPSRLTKIISITDIQMITLYEEKS